MKAKSGERESSATRFDQGDLAVDTMRQKASIMSPFEDPSEQKMTEQTLPDSFDGKRRAFCYKLVS